MTKDLAKTLNEQSKNNIDLYIWLNRQKILKSKLDSLKK